MVLTPDGSNAGQVAPPLVSIERMLILDRCSFDLSYKLQMLRHILIVAGICSAPIDWLPLKTARHLSRGCKCRFATAVERLLIVATKLGLQMNYNTEIVKMTENPNGSFNLTSKDGRVSPLCLCQQSPSSCVLELSLKKIYCKRLPCGHSWQFTICTP